jgi:hypothetical protein
LFQKKWFAEKFGFFSVLPLKAIYKDLKYIFSLNIDYFTIGYFYQSILINTRCKIESPSFDGLSILAKLLLRTAT